MIYLLGSKGTITIKNYLGVWYYLTVDEIEICDNTVFLIEGKHTNKNVLPGLSDIQDGLIKMVLFANLEQVSIAGIPCTHHAVLKLTVLPALNVDSLSQRDHNPLS